MEVERALERFTAQAGGEEIDTRMVIKACQKFSALGQNFDANSADENVRNSSAASGWNRESLERLNQKLLQVIGLIEDEKAGIRERLRGVHHKQRALRGYQCLAPIHKEQYLSIRG